MELFENIIGLGGTEWSLALICSLKHVSLKISEADIYGGEMHRKLFKI